MQLFDGTESRLTMGDGRPWATRFRHEMTQIAPRGRQNERRLFLYFRDDAGAMRRVEVSDAFRDGVTDTDLRALWRRAEPWPPSPD